MFRSNAHFLHARFLCVWLASPFLAVLAQTSTSSTSPAASIPFVGGGYEFVMSYDEVRGDVGRENACVGPFPYQLTWFIDIYQVPSSPAIRFCITGTDCSEKYWDSVLLPATPLARKVRAIVFDFKFQTISNWCE
jgi:hypothetical protein